MLNYIIVTLAIIVVALVACFFLNAKRSGSTARRVKTFNEGCYPVETLEQLRASLALEGQTCHFDSERAFYTGVVTILNAWCGRARYIELLSTEQFRAELSSDVSVRTYAYRYSEIIKRVELARIG